MSDSNTSQACRGLLWNYDAWGNRTDQTQTSGTCNSFHATANTQNRLMDPINNVYKYDAKGSLTADGSHTYTYDAENRLVQVDGTPGNCSTATACYVYDALGRRVEKIQGANQTHYWYDSDGNVRVQWNQNSVWMVDYLYLNGQLVAEYKKGLTYFVHTDHLGSARLVTGLNQAVVQNLDYLPFGEHNSTDSAISTHEFTGDERDAETSLDHTQFRQYSSQFARWTTPDPAGLLVADPSNPQSWNRYAYVLNNPLNLIDPLGLDCTDVVNPDGSITTTCTVTADGGGDGGSGDDGGGGSGAPNSLTLLLEAGCPRNSIFVPVPFGLGWCVPGEKEGESVKQPRGRGNSGGSSPSLPKCSSLGAVGILAAGISKASQWTGTGYTLGLNGNALKAVGVGVDLAGSVALVSDPSGNVGIAKSLSVTPSVGARSYGGGIIIGGSTYSSLSGYSSYSQVNFTTTFGAGLATGFTKTSNSSGISTTAYLGFGTGGSAGGKGLSVTNNVQAFCKQ